MNKSFNYLLLKDFKSFVGTTKIGPFNKYTKIVGVNMLGKVDLMDAILFVLCNSKVTVTEPCSVELNYNDIQFKRGISATNQTLTHHINNKPVSPSYYVHTLIANKIYLDDYTNRLQILSTEKLCEFVFSSPSFLSQLFEKFSGSIEFRNKYSALTKKYEQTREEILQTNRELKKNRVSVKNLEAFIALEKSLDKNKLESMLADFLLSEININVMNNNIASTMDQLNEIEIKISAANDCLEHNKEECKKMQNKLKKLDYYGKKHLNASVTLKQQIGTPMDSIALKRTYTALTETISLATKTLQQNKIKLQTPLKVAQVSHTNKMILDKANQEITSISLQINLVLLCAENRLDNLKQNNLYDLGIPTRNDLSDLIMATKNYLKTDTKELTEENRQSLDADIEMLKSKLFGMPLVNVHCPLWKRNDLKADEEGIRSEADNLLQAYRFSDLYHPSAMASRNCVKNVFQHVDDAFVVDSFEVAEMYMSQLTDNNIGGVEFLILEGTTASSREAIPDERYMPFSHLVKFKERFTDQLSAYTDGLDFVYCKDINDAANVAFDSYFKRNAVLDDGTMFTTDGAITFGSCIGNDDHLPKTGTKFDLFIEQMLHYNKLLNLQYEDDITKYTIQRRYELYNESVEAFEKWLGNDEYNLNDFLKSIYDCQELKSMLPDPGTSDVVNEISEQVAFNNATQSERQQMIDSMSQLRNVRNDLSDLVAKQGQEAAQLHTNFTKAKLMETHMNKSNQSNHTRIEVDDQLKALNFHSERVKDELESLETTKAKSIKLIKNYNSSKYNSQLKIQKRLLKFNTTIQFKGPPLADGIELDTVLNNHNVINGNIINYDDLPLSYQLYDENTVQKMYKQYCTNISEMKTKMQKLQKQINNSSNDSLINLRRSLGLINKHLTILQQSFKQTEQTLGNIRAQRHHQFQQCFQYVETIFDEYFKLLYENDAAQTYMQMENESEPYLDGIVYTSAAPGESFTSKETQSQSEMYFVAMTLLLAMLSYNCLPFVIFEDIDDVLDAEQMAMFDRFFAEDSEQQIILLTNDRCSFNRASTAIAVVMEDNEKDKSKVIIHDV